MKNVERLQSRPFFRVPLHGAPPLRGWAVQYVSGIDDAEIKAGYWLSQWNPTSDRHVTFNFESELVMSFTEEVAATSVAKALRDTTEIETKVVKIG